MNHLLLLVGTFAAAFVVLQLLVLGATVVVHLLFPDWESAKQQLRKANARSLQYAVAAGKAMHKYLLWVLLGLFTLLTFIYS